MMDADDVDGRTAVVWEDGTATRVAPEGVIAGGGDISDRGHVVGTVLSSDPWQAYFWFHGEWSLLGAEDVESRAFAVNEHGQVLGNRAAGPGSWTPVVWQDGDVVDEADGAGGGTAINDRGQAVVRMDVAGSPHAAIWQVGGEVTDLGTLGGPTSWGVDINEAGDVIGYSETDDSQPGGPLFVHPFLWREGEMVDLGTLGGFRSQPNAVNEFGHVAGFSRDGNAAFLWREGEMIDLGTLGGSWAYAWDLNDHDQVVGSSETDTGERHAFLWEDGQMIDLGALIPDDEGNSRAYAINNQGQIVGTIGDYPNSRAVLWTLPTATGM